MEPRQRFGNVVAICADIAAEAGARQTYEALIKLAPDEDSKKALTFLLTREIWHTQMFMKALESLGKLTGPLLANARPDETVNPYFAPGEVDSRRSSSDCGIADPTSLTSSGWRLISAA
jgi:Mn-containing catalase